MELKTFLFLVVIFVFLFPGVNALSLSGDQISPIIYVPGKIIENPYDFGGTDKEVEVTISGSPEISSYFSLSEIVNNHFTLIITFPEQLEINPGTYRFNLAVTELANKGGKISSLLSVARQFIIEVYSYEKAIEASLSAPSINEGGVVNFGVGVKSRSYSDIDDVHATISVFDQFGKKVGEVLTESKFLESLSSISLTAPFDAKDLPLGDYRAEAVVVYDGKQMVIEDEFKIGNLDVLVENYTSQVFQGFSDFTVKVKNNWGNEIQNVYAQLFIENEKILHTPSINLVAWGGGELSAIGNFDFSPGDYPATLKIFFEGEQKEEQIDIEILEVKKEETDNNVLIILLIGTTIALILIVLIIYYKKKIKVVSL